MIQERTDPPSHALKSSKKRQDALVTPHGTERVEETTQRASDAWIWEYD